MKHGYEFKCDNCDIKFNNQTNFDAHIRENHLTYKPCKTFATNECEYEGECRFRHIILQRGQHICYKCGVIFNSKTDLTRHIKNVHGNEICKKFKENKCQYGSKCHFKHTQIVQRQEQAIPTNQDFPALPIPAQGFQEPPTPQIPFNIMNMIPQIVSQIVIALTLQNKQQTRV